jgi:outer membrane beta-barrel protein
MDSIRLLSGGLRRVLVVLAVIAGLCAAELPVRAQECIDEEAAARLSVKRKRRGRVPRVFVKAQRHELSLLGGWFVSDLFSGAWLAGGAYTYHMTEDAAIEATYLRTTNDAELARAIEDGRAQLIKDLHAPISFASSTLLWYPLHGKLRAGGGVIYFDTHLDLGVGAVDSPTSRGAMGIGGLGFKLYWGKAVAIRFDARDYVYRQELLDSKFIVNDVSVTLGVSMFLPWRF